MKSKNKIHGTLLGILVGDTLGAPVEMLTAEQIKKRVGYIDCIIDSKEVGRKRVKGMPTDDTQLTLAVADGILENPNPNVIDMSAIAKQHIKSYKETTDGWGGTTRVAVKNLVNEASWDEAASTDENHGYGNGVAMKISPFVLYAYSMALNRCLKDKKAHSNIDLVHENMYEYALNLSKMSHTTQVSVATSYAYEVALFYCLVQDIDSFDIDNLKTVIHYALMKVSKEDIDGFTESGKELEDLWLKFAENPISDPAKIAEMFGTSCACSESVLFSLAMFVSNYKNIDCLFDTVNQGGDTDTTGALVGSLLGALHGFKIFPKKLIKQTNIDYRKKVSKVTNSFVKLAGGSF